jgi:tRNA/tmRNA/rRNA uracil-C5-methylase (TrmA/RlmC/RlmD family)
LDAIVELLTSGQPWLVASGLLLLFSLPAYLYVSEIMRQRDEWKDRWEKRTEQFKKFRNSRLEEMKSTKQALEKSVQVQDKLREELRKQRKQDQLLSDLKDEIS